MDIARSIIGTLEDKKGEDILLLDIQSLSLFTDYFIICSGTSDRMLRSLANSVIEDAKKDYDLNGRMEGKPEEGWVLVDLGSIIIHLFSPDKREYYQLEKLWIDGKVLIRLQ